MGGSAVIDLTLARNPRQRRHADRDPDDLLARPIRRERGTDASALRCPHSAGADDGN